MPVFSLLVTLKAGAATASDILEAMRQSPPPGGRTPAVASFYRTLKRALEAGYVEDIGASPASGQAGRPGQTFQITEAGKRAMRAEAARLGALVAAATDRSPSLKGPR